MKGRLIHMRPEKAPCLLQTDTTHKSIFFFNLSNKLTTWPEGLDSEQTQALPWGRPFKMETGGGTVYHGQIKLTLKTIRRETQQKLMCTCQ